MCLETMKYVEGISADSNYRDLHILSTAYQGFRPEPDVQVFLHVDRPVITYGFVWTQVYDLEKKTMLEENAGLDIEWCLPNSL